jgi:hypothetical protein
LFVDKTTLHVHQKVILKVARNRMVWIVGGPYMGVVAVGYLILCKLGLITKQNVFSQVDAVPV